ncbi:MAG: cytochrome b/b6 domain-containing protein [Betaproteobacteria bacterium]
MTTAVSAPTTSGGALHYRHTLPVRLMHWINVVALTIMFMSGLSIFNAHPALYWGKSSYTGRPPIVEIRGLQAGNGELRGVTRVFGHEFDTTGVLGVSADRAGNPAVRGFPWWLTIPDNQWLSMARTWHFFFAWIFVLNGLAYIAWTVGSRHLARDLAPDKNDLRSIGQSIRDHLRLRHPAGEAAKRYNVLQKIAYLKVIFVLLPLAILMGFAMSPWANAIWPGWIDIVGGRQSARTIHFVVAWLLVAFVFIHLFALIVAGPWNHLRSMITGRYRVPTEAGHE